MRLSSRMCEDWDTWFVLSTLVLFETSLRLRNAQNRTSVTAFAVRLNLMLLLCLLTTAFCARELQNV